MGISPLGRGFQEVYGFLLRMVGSKRNSLRETFFFFLPRIQTSNTEVEQPLCSHENGRHKSSKEEAWTFELPQWPWSLSFRLFSRFFLPFFPISSGILYFWGSNLAQNECSVEFLAFEPVVAVV